LSVWFGLAGREEPGDDENQEQNGGRSVHVGDYMSLPDSREDTKNTSLFLSVKKNHLVSKLVIPRRPENREGRSSLNVVIQSVKS